jgi:hypothetical protein
MKRLKPTDKIKEKLAAALGSDDFAIENFAVFETIAINDLPVSKIGSIYDGSRMTEATLQAMVDYINKETFLPLHTLHQQSRELPVGRVFHAELHKTSNQNGRSVNEVRALFYIPVTNDAGKQLADSIDTGIVNEVSVGSRPQKLMCSGHDCNFDYMAPNTFMNWLDQTCPNDHTIGQNGIHVIFDGLRKFYELSLVSQGAADHARIVAPDQSIAAANDDLPSYQVLYATKGKEDKIMKLTAAQVAELRASLEKDGKRAIDAKFAGIVTCMGMIKDDMTLSDAEALRTLFKTSLAEFNTANPENPANPANPGGGDNGGEKLNLSIAEVIDLKADNKVQANTIATLKTESTAKDTQIATLTTENTTLKGHKAQLDALLAEITPVKEFLKVQCQAMLVASGVTNPTVPESFSDLIATINTAKGKLSKLPVGGLLLSAESGSPGEQNPTAGSKDPSVFKTKK